MKRKTRPSEGKDLDVGSKPVETTQHAEVTKVTEVKIPRSQAVWVAIPLSAAVIVTILSPIALGPRIFYAAAGLCAMAAFLWSLIYEMTWQDRVTLPFLVGIVAWCFWRFADFAGWRAPEAWQPFSAILAIGSLTFWWTFTAAMWLTMWQRLGMPMYHQQYSLWRAVGNLIEHWGKKEREPRPQAQDLDPPIVFEFVYNGANNSQTRLKRETPFGRSVMVWVARILAEETMSEASLCGMDKPLSGRDELDILRDWMIEHKLMVYNVMNGNGEPVKTQGVSLTEDGVRWVAERGRWSEE